MSSFAARLRDRIKPQVARERADEPLRGWRAWQVVEGREGLALTSWLMSTRWPARRALEGGCFLHGRQPVAHHHCGIHAFADHEDVLSYIEHGDEALGVFRRRPLAIAVGRVSAWGRVVAHTRGWRAQYAYPYDLYLTGGDRGLARQLADRYAVETMLLGPA